MNQLMRMVGDRLNLKAHIVGRGSNERILYGPIDMEGHKARDGFYYLIDTARLFPPEAPTSNDP